MEAAAALTTTTGAQYSCCFGLAHGGAAQRRRRTAAGFGAARWSGRRLRALPPQVSEFLSPEQLVPGSPADTGDVSSLIPIRQSTLYILYFTSIAYTVLYYSLRSIL
jgi:hypothetical protein